MWKQTSPTTFEHERSIFEQLYFLTQGIFGEPAPWTLFTNVKIRHRDCLSGDQLVASLRNAWAQVRAKEPQIAARHGETTKIVDVLEGDALEKFLSETFVVCRDKTPDDMFRDCVSRPYMTLFYFPASQELALHANHSFVDGRGSLFFWDTFFSVLANPEETPVTPDIVKKALPPCVDRILGVPESSSSRAEECARKIIAGGITDNPVSIPARDPTAPPKGFLRRQIKLGPEISSKIFDVCKQRGITVTAAVHVAFGLAIQEHQLQKEGKAGDVWAGFTNLDARKFFGDEYSDQLRRVACHFIISPFHVHIDPKAYDKSTADLSDYYRTTLDHPFAEGLREALPAALPVYLKAMAEGASFTKTPWITALGVIENFMGRSFGPWEVDDFWLANCIANPILQLLLWTWRGQVVLGVAYNETFFDGDVLEGILKRSGGVLLQSLGVEE
ncbi:hypothetical protein FZEAL_6166 [Fusarium zealandicum]|uniref:Acyltransferase n=1 Tax=Fusarium zealandicum TaxID=1053134 RepID=A0A8H4XJV8_9HYPO|nr:hypothetical protein FZEAL_6166 [Fusarium zealandicum]